MSAGSCEGLCSLAWQRLPLSWSFSHMCFSLSRGARLQVKAALCAALYPNAAVKDESAGKAARPAWNDGVADVYIHPSSINHPLEAQQFLRPYLVYLEKVRAN